MEPIADKPSRRALADHTHPFQRGGGLHPADYLYAPQHSCIVRQLLANTPIRIVATPPQHVRRDDRADLCQVHHRSFQCPSPRACSTGARVTAQWSPLLTNQVGEHWRIIRIRFSVGEAFIRPTIYMRRSSPASCGSFWPTRRSASSRPLHSTSVVMTERTYAKFITDHSNALPPVHARHRLTDRRE